MKIDQATITIQNFSPDKKLSKDSRVTVELHGNDSEELTISGTWSGFLAAIKGFGHLIQMAPHLYSFAEACGDDDDNTNHYEDDGSSLS